MKKLLVMISISALLSACGDDGKSSSIPAPIVPAATTACSERQMFAFADTDQYVQNAVSVLNLSSNLSSFNFIEGVNDSLISFTAQMCEKHMSQLLSNCTIKCNQVSRGLGGAHFCPHNDQQILPLLDLQADCHQFIHERNLINQ